LAQLLDTRSAKTVFPSIKFIVSANINPAHNDISERAARVGVKVIGLYGSSEVQALFSHCSLDWSAEGRGRPGGFPASASAKVRTRDPETKQLCKVDEAGELEIFAPESRFLEYFNDPEATRSAFTEDGYFRTGDLGITRPDGSFDFLARMGDVLRLGGFLVSPAEIEELIQQHPTVASCQIVGVSVQNAIRPIAFVIPRNGAQLVEREIIGFVADRLAKYKVPVKVYAVDEFPTTPSANGSKVQKNKLREMAEHRLAQTV
jgi:fatty-acyl-CoA synthase